MMGRFERVAGVFDSDADADDILIIEGQLSVNQQPVALNWCKVLKRRYVTIVLKKDDWQATDGYFELAQLKGFQLVTLYEIWLW